jgi:low temperature requirement protein LtrA
VNEAKRVSWVELYFDLVFVFAVAQVAHGIAAEPRWRIVFAALGLFVTLWWTWIGYVLLYNRRGDDRSSHRLFILAGTVPCAIAATQAHHAFAGHPAGFALALAGARLVLAVAYLVSSREGEDEPYVRRVGWGYAASTVVIAGSAFLHGPWNYLLWAYAIVQEAAIVLLRWDRSAERPRGRREALRAQFVPPADAAHAVDAGHLAERFGLFVIILLGEIVVSIGGAALDRPDEDLAYWLSLGGGLVLAAALWWIYFNSAADIGERLLVASGGNPALANNLYAAGHLVPAFSLLAIAAGVNLALHADPPTAAPWLVTGGLTGYIAGTRALSALRRQWYAGLARVLVLAATAGLALLQHVLTAPAVVVVTAGWAAGAAAVVTWSRRGVLRRLGDDPLAFLRGTNPAS